MGWYILLGILALTLVAFPLIALIAYFVLSPQNRWFTFVKDGTAKIIVKGTAVDKILIQWQGYTFSYGEQDFEKKWTVIEGREPSHPFGGFRFYSLFYPLFDVYIYRHRWTHLHEDGTVKTHDEWLDFVFLKRDLYVIEIPLIEGKEKTEEGAEDINGVPLGIQIVIPMRIINPYIAIFRVRRWLPMISGVVQAKLRRFVANYRYKEDLLNLRAGEGIKEVQRKAGVPEERLAALGEDLWEKFWGELEKEFIQRGAEKLPDERFQIYGVEIEKKGSGVLKIEPGSSYRRFTTMTYETEREKERTIIQAKAERERLKTVAEGEKIRIETVYEAIDKFKDLGRLVRSLEAMEKSTLAASVSVQAIPGLQEVLRGVFGKPPEAINPQEFRELREMIEKLVKEKEGKG